MGNEIVTLDSFAAARFHGNRWNAPSNQLRRRIGEYITTYVGDRCGTVRDAAGKYWDWWLGDDGIVSVHESM